MTSTVEVPERDRVVEVTLKRPHRLNALNATMAVELAAVLDDVTERDPTTTRAFAEGREPDFKER